MLFRSIVCRASSPLAAAAAAAAAATARGDHLALRRSPRPAYTRQTPQPARSRRWARRRRAWPHRLRVEDSSFMKTLQAAKSINTHGRRSMPATPVLQRTRSLASFRYPSHKDMLSGLPNLVRHRDWGDLASRCPWSGVLSCFPGLPSS